MEPKGSVAQYTQDCKSISSVRSLVNTVDYSCVRESSVDVGYICKKCQMVFPSKAGCENHQQTVCFTGQIPEGITPMLKLEQIQYECRLCTDKFSTVQEFKTHCGVDTHKTRVARLQHKSSSSTSPAHSQSKLGDSGCIMSPNSSSSNILSSSPKCSEASSLNLSGGSFDTDVS